MKPCKLEFCGINSFSEVQTVDFAKLLEYGIFGIFGDTGSGKSTILDSIVFALYGSVTRTGGKNKADIVNYNLDRAYVNFVFELSVGGVRNRYRVEREIRKKNGDQKVKVYVWENEAWRTVADGTATKCNDYLKNLLGLEKEEFEKCIALPQGEFAQFVKAGKGERLALVSHLFNLEAYGERLSKKVNQKANETKSAADICKAKLEQYASATEERERELKAASATLQEERARINRQLETGETEARRLAALFEIKTRRESLEREWTKLCAQKEEMDALETSLSRLAYAEHVAAARRDEAKKRTDVTDRSAQYREADERLQRAEREREEAGTYDFEGAEQEAERLTQEAARTETYEQLQSEKARYLQDFARVCEEIAEESKLFVGYDYEAEHDSLAKRLEALGRGDFVQFAKEEFKAELFRGEYAVFAAELREAGERYPAAQEAISPLQEKYERLSSGEKRSYEEAKEAYEAREAKRKELYEKLRMLEKLQGSFLTHCIRLQNLQTRSAELKRETESREARLAGMSAETGAKESLQKKRAEIKARRAADDERARRIAACERECAEKRAQQNAAEEALREAEERLLQALKSGGFSSADEAEELLKKFGSAEQSQARLNEYREQVTLVKNGFKETEGRDVSAVTKEAVDEANARVRSLKERYEKNTRDLAVNEQEQTLLQEQLARKKQYSAEYESAKAEAELYAKLKSLLYGNEFMEFIAEEYLNDIAFRASERLLRLTGGRYCLHYGDGAFSVGDNFNGGERRGVHTLSGGETFLVSLSLALALSARICEKSLRPMEFFFLDEGFGTLDSSLVDTVIDSLFTLKSKEFSIGVISHVEELKHRIEKKLTVKKATERHGSQILEE